MIIIVDVNIILSALIKDSTTREIIVKSNFEFYFPEPSLQKIRKYKEYIKQKSNISQLEFLKLFYSLIRFIKIIPKEEILSNWNKAKEIMEHIDPEDTTIVAAALSKNDAVIWSDDKHFEQQNKITIFKTRDIVDLYKELNQP